MVQWDEVPADNQNGIVVNYTVTYAELPAGDSGKEIVIAPRTNQWCIDRIEKIYQLQHHSVCIYSQGGGGGGGRKSEPIIVITDEDRKNSQFWYYPVGCYVLIWNL